MPTLNRCYQCRRRYFVIGLQYTKHSPWLCPNCKKAKNLPKVLLGGLREGFIHQSNRRIGM